MCENNNNTIKNGKQCISKEETVSKKPKFREKVFVERRSMIHEMYEVEHIRNIRLLFICLLLTCYINQIVDGIIHERRFSLHINVIYESFGDIHVAIRGWLILFTCTVLVYPVFQLWIILQTKISSQIIWLTILLAYYYKIFAWTADYVTEHDLSFASSFALLIEASRLLMKTHAFVRTRSASVLNDKQTARAGSMLHYVEFLFMPTIVYRDSYPRTKSVNWHNVLLYVLELCGCMLFACYIYNIYFSSDCDHFKTTTSYEREDFAWLIFRNTIPSLTLCFIMFYFVLHVWQNLFAELLRFGDRQFYQDWWNSVSYDEFFRKWNTVVHDWLYNYVYKEIYTFYTPKGNLVPRTIVFLISAIVHEYVLCYSMRMFFPLLGTMFFTFAMIFTSFKTPKCWIFNVLFVYGLAWGYSINITSYITEYCVRQNPIAMNSSGYPYAWMYSKTLFNDMITN